MAVPRLIPFILVVVLLSCTPPVLGESAGAAVFRAPRVDFDGDFRANVTNVSFATDAMPVRLVASGARILVTWDEAVWQPGLIEAKVRNGSHVIELGPCELLVTPLPRVGLVAGHGEHAEVDAQRMRVHVLDSFERYWFNHKEEVLEFPGDFDITHVPAASFPEFVLFARNASIRGDATVDVTYSERAVPATSVRFVNSSHARIELTDVTLHPAGDATALALSATRFDAAGEGRVRFQGAAGWVAEGAAASVRGDDVTLRGSLTIHGERGPGPRSETMLRSAHATAPVPRWSVSGSFDSVHVGENVLVDARTGLALAGAAVLLIGLALYSRIRDNAVLRHPTRRAIVDAVRARPARAQEDVQEELGLAKGTFRYHLQVLRSRRLVIVRREGRRTLLLPPAVGVPRHAVLPRRGKARAVLRFIERAGTVTAADVTEALGVSHQLAYHHLNALTERGLLEKDGGHPARYRVREG